MSNKRRHTPKQRRSSDDSEENLRGRLRELEKDLREERRYSRSLEKKLSIANIGDGSDDEESSSPDYKPPIASGGVCKKCGESNVKLQTVNAPHKRIVWACCQDCDYKEKISSHDK